jgi:hypothetical protein
VPINAAPAVAGSTLNPDAMAWMPALRSSSNAGVLPATAALPLLSLQLSILDMIPCDFRRQFKDMFTCAKQALSKSDFIDSVSIFEGPGLWGKGMTIAATVRNAQTGDAIGALLKTVQEALLKRAEESESVYVMGYSLRPFTVTERGFAAMVGGMRDDGWACWDVLTKGFCENGRLCCKQHPTCMIPIYVEITEATPASKAPEAREIIPVGTTVEYFSNSIQRWIPTTVLGFSEQTGNYRLDVKASAPPKSVRILKG